MGVATGSFDTEHNGMVNATSDPCPERVSASAVILKDSKGYASRMQLSEAMR